MWRSSLWSVSWLRHQMFHPYIRISAAQARESDDLRHAMSAFSFCLSSFLPGVVQVFNKPTASSCYRRWHWREHRLPLSPSSIAPYLALSHSYARLMQIKSKLLCSLLNSAYSLRYLKTFQSLCERLFIFSITPVNEVRGKLILGWQKKKEWPRYNGQSVCVCVF